MKGYSLGEITKVFDKFVPKKFVIVNKSLKKNF